MTTHSIKPKAIVLTDGMLHQSDAKTAHGLIRGTDRFNIVAIIDSVHAGKDAGIVLDGKHRNIPVLTDVAAAMDTIDHIKYCIIGIATVGGILPAHFIPILASCIRHRIALVNGLHDYLTNIPELVALADKYDVSLTDVRKPKDRKDLHFWDASIFTVTAPIVAVIGTDCALGKRTTCRMLMHACNEAGIKAEMIYTGQTGWLQGGKYGFIFDSTLNDFISGEIEHAVVSCWLQTKPDIIFIEGQSALRNPSGPCGSELLISGNAKHVVLVHAPKRKYYDHLPSWGVINTVESEIVLINMYGSKVIGIALNTEDCTNEEALQFQRHFSEALNIPVLLPLQKGVESLIPTIQPLLNTAV
jgi:uncharacterized NAD-dependent epimerase/dehydratase family protein